MPLPLSLIRLFLPAAERDEIIADLEREFIERTAADGRPAAHRWLWSQVMSSLPALIRWTWWRGRTGYEPRSSAFRPRSPIVKNWITDAHYALRRLRRRPAYTILAVLTLALGIGGTAAAFGIARPLILDPLPYANAKNVAAFWMDGTWNEEELLYLRGKYPGFTRVGGYRWRDLTLREGDTPARILPGEQVTADLFDVLGAKPLIGRTFRPGDDAPGSEPLAMISYGLWQELGGKPSIVGSRLNLNGAQHTVIGVMPKKFWFPNPEVRVWHTKPLDPQGRNGSYTLLGLVATGTDINRMQPQIAQLTRIMGERFRYPKDADKTINAQVKPLREYLLGPMRPAVVATFAGMSLILLIACTNVAALMLGQVEGRATELAVRSALGATLGRITQQLVVEALALGILAGLVGSMFAYAGFGLLARALPIGAWSESSAFDWTLFFLALAISVAAVLLIVLVPAASVWRGNARDVLSRARTGGVSGRGGRLEHTLVVIEVALAMLIATGAGLLVRSVTNRYAIDPGIETRNVAVVDVSTGPELTRVQRLQKIEEVLQALSTIPGVKSAAATMKIPLRGADDSFGITIEGREREENTFTYFRVGTIDYFQTLGFRLHAGRVFNTGDRPDSTEMPVVINEALAKKYFPGENPIGKRLGGGFGIPQRIIGVVADAAEGELKADGEPTRYYLAGVIPWFSTRATFVIKASGVDPASVLDQARNTVQRVAPGFPIQATTTMSRVFDTAIGPARQIMSLLSMLSGLALILGGVGIYGVISHFAIRRMRDWAIRVALGLRGSGVVIHIVRQGVGLAILGIAVGALGAFALTRLLTTFLFGVSAVDPIAFGGASLVLIVIGAVAAFIPARRAGTVDPALVLREQ